MAKSRPLSPGGPTAENRDDAASPRVSWKERLSTTIPRSSTVDSTSTYRSTVEDVGGDNEGPQNPQRRNLRGSETKLPLSPRSTLVTDSAWTKQYILSLDGGGVRGYSTLLILKALMEEIATIELKHEEPALRSSFSPYIQQYDQDGYQSSTPKSFLLISRSTRLTNSSGGSQEDPKATAGDTPEISSQFLPCHYFDYIAGTSTGGLIAIMLGRLRMNISDCIDQFFNMSKQVFGEPKLLRGLQTVTRSKYLHLGQAKYHSGKLEAVVKEAVEDRARLDLSQKTESQFRSSSEQCKCFVIAFERGSTKGSSIAVDVPYIFRTYDHPRRGAGDPLERNPGDAEECPIWVVARATSAAPSYFKPVTIEEKIFIDGGFYANNPSWLALNEVRQMHLNTADPIGLICSIGTGLKKSTSRRKSSVTRFTNTVAWSGAQTELTHKQLLTENLTYHRLNVENGLEDIRLDEWKPRKTGASTITCIERATGDYLRRGDIRKLVHDCAVSLVESRRLRARTLRWEAFALGYVYRCPEDDCPDKKRVFQRRDKLMDHLHLKHGVPPLEPDTYDRLKDLLDRGRVSIHDQGSRVA